MMITSVFNMNPAITISIPMIRKSILTIDRENGNFELV